MITQKQLSIFEVFARKPFAAFTRSQIKKTSNEKSNNTLALTINLLKKEDVVAEQKVGKSGLLTLNFHQDLTYFYLALCNNQRISHVVKLSLTELQEEINNITPFYSLVIFGSYAIGEQKQTSDLDVAVFIESEEKVKRVIASINSAKLKAPLDIDAHVIPRAEMIEMLTNEEENLGKQIARKHLAIHNHRIFYDLIKEGMKRGFRI
jgi:predicted nucleotidyltransferase